MRNILITGASSGIGAALAQDYAAAGVTLRLAGRDAARLEAVAQACRARGAAALADVLDVRDAAAAARWVESAGRLDLVIANAGIGAGSEGGVPEPASQVRAILATNLDGALNVVLPALEVMATQQPGPDGLRGRIAAIASIAGLIASPGAPTYCASKAALDTWMVATAPLAARQGIRLTSICPGFIHTPMTAANRFPMPGIMQAEAAARKIRRGIEAGKLRLAFPWWLAAAARIGDLLPPAWIGRGGLRLPGKARQER